MSILPKVVIFLALVCPIWTAADAIWIEQGSSESKVEKYTLEPVATSEAIYPPAAKEQKLQGKVAGMILVSETGGVESVRFFKGDAILAAAAEQAAKQWKFKPVTKDSRPVPVIAGVTFNFVLPENPQDAKDVTAELDQATSFPQSVRVSDSVMRGMIQRKINPPYPEKARNARIEGTVTMRVRINKEGEIADLQVVSGPKALVPSALEAVHQWQYKPYLFMGRPVEVESDIQVNFSLSSR
jgi:TonB family protein